MTCGLLCSQIGYDTDEPVRVVYRSDTADALSPSATIRMRSAGALASAPMQAWGRCWSAQWWTGEVAPQHAGVWDLELHDGGRIIACATIDVEPHRLWRASWREVALEQLERRTRIAGLGHGTGWQDAGCDWQEANSHAACLVGLCDVHRLAGQAIDDATRSRVAEQIRAGCRLLDRLQDEAAKDGLPAGSLIHEPRRFRRALQRDAVWAALAWARAAHASGGAEAEAWRVRARAALAWWRSAPCVHDGMDPVAHGWKPGYAPPAEPPAVDRGLAAWAWCELAATPDDADGCAARELAAQLIALQIPPKGEAPYGHFWEFSDRAHPASVWTHNMLGPDTGETGLGPAWVLSRLLARWPLHHEAEQWRRALAAYAEGWLLPLARASPFAIAARTWNDGWVHFGGLWHGMNAVYCHTAALADDLAGLLDMPQLRRIAQGNRQWIAGLHAGLTAASVLRGCHLTRPTSEPGAALSAAMIQGIGRRWVGGWMAIPGSIPNGFSSGDQFRFDVPADPANDAPDSFTDEDWIVHAGGWLMAVARQAG